MADTKISTAIADVDTFLNGITSKLEEIAAREKATAESFAKEYQDLYATVPEGRMRTFSEIVAVKSRLDLASGRLASMETIMTRPVPLP